MRRIIERLGGPIPAPNKGFVETEERWPSDVPKIPYGPQRASWEEVMAEMNAPVRVGETGEGGEVLARRRLRSRIFAALAPVIGEVPGKDGRKRVDVGPLRRGTVVSVSEGTVRDVKAALADGGIGLEEAHRVVLSLPEGKERMRVWREIQALRTEAVRGKVEGTVGLRKELGEQRVSMGAKWARGDVGCVRLSRRQKGRVPREQLMAGVKTDNATCQDAMLCRPDVGVYAVFDGMGGEKGGREAAWTAARAVLARAGRLGSREGCKEVLEETGRIVAGDPEAGVTTGVVARIVEREGQKILVVGSAGDSRAYITRRDGETRQITYDEGEGSGICNGIGRFRSGKMGEVWQCKEIPVEEGDKFMLCSDGVTGDKRAEALGEDRIGSILHRAKTAQEAAARLVEASKKADDTTVVVGVV